MQIKKRDTIFLLFFFLTLCTTLLTGLQHARFFYYPSDEALRHPLTFFLHDPRVLLNGIFFSLLLMLILFSHEMGHYLTARRGGMASTLPFFIPGPPILSGTFGAVILIRSPFPERRTLLEVGANGPIAGFLVTVPILAIGLSLSKTIPVHTEGGWQSLGEPLLLKFLTHLILPRLQTNQDFYIHPLALAGWFGLIVTSMNLLPAGQLDGGHIAYAILGRKAEFLSLGIIITLICLGAFFWPGWLLWALLLTLIGYRHPQVPAEIPLNRQQIWKALLCLLIFILSFTPAPFPL